MSLTNLIAFLPKRGQTVALVVTLFSVAAVWITSIQIATAQNTAAVREIREEIKPMETIREDVRWIKKKLGGPD